MSLKALFPWYGEQVTSLDIGSRRGKTSVVCTSKHHRNNQPLKYTFTCFIISSMSSELLQTRGELTFGRSTITWIDLPWKCPIELLSDIVSAERVLEGKEELVVLFDHGVALHVAGSSVCRSTLLISTLSIYIHLEEVKKTGKKCAKEEEAPEMKKYLYVLFQFCDIIFSVWVSVAIWSNPSN